MNIGDIVRTHYDSLTDVDLLIWQFISNNLEQTTKLSITELAKLCNASRTSVLRFSQKLGLQGYGELKLIIKQSLQTGNEPEPTNIDLRASLYSETILDFVQEDYSLLFERIAIAKRVFIYTSELTETLVAQYFKRLFFEEDVLVFPIWGNHEIKRLAEKVSKDDVIVFLALEGDDLMLEVLPQFIKKQAFVVNVARRGDSIIQKLSDFNISLNSEIDGGNSVLFVAVELLHSMYVEFIEGGYHDEN